MIHSHIMTFTTKINIIVFCLFYSYYLSKKAKAYKLHVIDYFMLLNVALIPALFVIFPGYIQQLSNFIGIQFPFLLLFGSLILILFLILLLLCKRIQTVEQQMVVLAQKYALDTYIAQDS
jgi:hypothetical protein